jgi:CDGSH-type Zn-finger protein
MTKIKSLKDGPYQVSGGVTVEDASGGVKEFSADQTASLCRCGQSKNKPYCDGTHAKIGFKADK